MLLGRGVWGKTGIGHPPSLIALADAVGHRETCLVLEYFGRRSREITGIEHRA